MKYGFQIRRYPADWVGEMDATGSYKAGGPKRNSKMIKMEHAGQAGQPIDLALAFTADLERSRGTKDCVKKARAAGIKVNVILI